MKILVALALAALTVWACGLDVEAERHADTPALPTASPDPPIPNPDRIFSPDIFEHEERLRPRLK